MVLLFAQHLSAQYCPEDSVLTQSCQCFEDAEFDNSAKQEFLIVSVDCQFSNESSKSAVKAEIDSLIAHFLKNSTLNSTLNSNSSPVRFELVFSHPHLPELDSNFFSTPDGAFLPFKRVQLVDLFELERIDANLFNSQQLVQIESFDVINATRFQDESLFKVLCRMPNLRTLKLIRTGLRGVPKNAFNSEVKNSVAQLRLKQLVIEGDCRGLGSQGPRDPSFGNLGPSSLDMSTKVPSSGNPSSRGPNSRNPDPRVHVNAVSSDSKASIGSRAFFTLTNLVRLDLSCLGLSEIEPNAFRFKEPSSRKLYLYLTGNNLTEASFPDKFLTAANRPVELFLDYNPLSSIPESKLAPFLDSNHVNRLSIWQSPKSAKLRFDCGIGWLIESRTHYREQVEDVICSDGQLLWQHEEVDLRQRNCSEAEAIDWCLRRQQCC